MSWRDCCIALIASVTLGGCDKVPIRNVDAFFEIAAVSWFEAEETVFVFYRVTAEQGLDPTSVVQISYTTDAGRTDWTDIRALPPVHLHEEVVCGNGITTLCGSTSFALALEPRDVDLRLLYRPNSSVELRSEIVFNVVNDGPAHTNRSALVYGVFDEENRRVQWRTRNVFPTVRNEEATDLGLRRELQVDDQRFGTVDATVFEDNLYGYGFETVCPATFAPIANATPLATLDRASFEAEPYSDEVLSAPAVCARTTVFDARGEFAVAAVARKNPDAREAFPLLRTPVRETRELGYLLRFCGRTISEPHEAMQEQRLLLSGEPTICLDDWEAPEFFDQLVDQVGRRVDSERLQGRDMSLKLALHHDVSSGALAQRIEDALVQLLEPESSVSSPRLTGALVFDSYGYDLTRPELERSVLWCPSISENPDAQECALQPDIPEFRLGPLGFSAVAILPTRSQYLTFIDRFSEAQGGEVLDLRFLVPQRTPTSEDVELGSFGVATFFNQEVLTVEPGSAFSACSGSLLDRVVFRTTADPAPTPVAELPAYHAATPAARYDVGLLWEFPWLLRMDYRVVGAGRISAFSLSVPFGAGVNLESFLGTEQWLRDEFELGDDLLLCRRFCDHPTFSSAGVYDVGVPFDPEYREECYRPEFPTQFDGGYPIDP